MSRRDQLAEVSSLLRTYWRYPASDAEIETLTKETKGWQDLSALVAAVRHATTTEDDRPSVAWIVREAARRRPERVTDTHRMCPECLGGGWIDEAEIGSPPMLRQCPECNPLGAQLHAIGAYRMDAPTLGARGDGFPQAQSLIDMFRSTPPPVPRTVLVARPQRLTEQALEYWQQHQRLNADIGSARQDRHRWLVGLGRAHDVPLPDMPVGDEAAVHEAASRLIEAGVPIDEAVLNIPTAEQMMHGATIKLAPLTRRSTEMIDSLQLFNYRKKARTLNDHQ